MPSVMQRVGTPNAQHNLENEYRKHLDHVDPTLSKYNEIIRHREVEDIYAEHLQPAFEKFNEKQKRKDRRLDVKWECSDALGYQRALDKAAQESNNKIGKKGRPPIREIVWQFGNPEQGFGCKDQTEASREFAKGLLLEAQAEAERRYPQFVWGDVVFHADEVSSDADDKDHGSFHLHADFVPICTKNKRGPEVQVAFERCLDEMGFSTFEEWKHNLDDIMETVLERHGLERTVMGNTNEHQDSKEFHRQQKVKAQTKKMEEKLEATQAELQKARGGIEAAKEEADGLWAEKTALKAVVEPLRDIQADMEACEIESTPVMLKSNEVRVKKTALEALQEQAKAYAINRPRFDNLDLRERELDEKERRAELRDKELKQREKKVEMLEKLPEAYSNLEASYYRIQNQWADLKKENDFLKRLLGRVKNALEKLFKGQWFGGLSEEQGRYVGTIIDEIGSHGHADLKDVLDSPIDAEYKSRKKVAETAALSAHQRQLTKENNQPTKESRSTTKKKTKEREIGDW